MKKTIQYISIIGLSALMFACQKQAALTEISANIVAPQITAMPTTLTYTTALANDTITFTASKVNPGFTASAIYELQVDTTGNQFKNPTTLASGIKDSIFKFSVSNFNATLLLRWLPYQATKLDFRIVATLDHSNAYNTVPVITAISPTVTAVITLYGLPQFNLVGSLKVPNQNIQSLGSNNLYSGLVKLDSAVAFTLANPVTGTKYGMAGATTMTLNGTTGFTVNATGWYLLSIDTAKLTFSAAQNFVGIIGTFDNWTGPDPLLNYNPRGGYWYITINLSASDQFKIRENNNWNGPPTSLNIGFNGSAAGTYNNIYNNGSSQNILSPGAGSWYITLTMGPGGNPCSMTMTAVNN